MLRETVAEHPDNSPEPNDVDLIHQIGEGCEASFRLLFRRWSPQLSRFLTRATGSPETGEDLLQEAFLRILKAARSFEPRGSTKAWIYRICANLAYSHWRKESSSPLRSSVPIESYPERFPTQIASPERERMRRALVRDATAALRRFPENQRIVFLLKVGQGLTYEEIAVVMRCPEGTVKSRFHHAVRKLRVELKAWDDRSRNL